MAPGDLTNELQGLTLSEPEYLLFNPTKEEPDLRGKFDIIPRYLFRVFTPKSDGTTDRFWVKSKDASDGRTNNNWLDIFSRDKNQVASMLNRHLRWWGKDEDPDNFVSWTSSLLFALQYIFYRQTHSRDGSRLDQICLCVIDTTSFPKGVFLRDMDLISTYSSVETGVANLDYLRAKKHDVHKGFFYFGEYLSQGALKIENKCQIVSAQAIIDQGLLRLQPELGKSSQGLWANQVILLREVFYQKAVEPQRITEAELRVAINIAQLFGPRWRLPIAANFIALLPRRIKDSAIIQAFRAAPFTGLPLLSIAESRLTGTDSEREGCSPLKTKVIAYDTLPEVQQFDVIIRSVYNDFCLTKLKS
jgi:hypothetical protein